MTAKFRPNQAFTKRLPQHEMVVNQLTDIAKVILGIAVANSPVRTGYYASRWQFVVIHEALRAVIRIFNDAEYAKYLEYGTRYMRAQRVLGRSVEQYRHL